MKKIIKLFLLLSISNFLFAQPHILWQKTYGGSGHDYATEIINTTDGGNLIVGYTRSNDSDVTVSYGGSDAWLVKINDVGTIQWQKSFGGSADDFFANAFQTSDNGYIVCGYTESNDSDVTFNHGARDCWVVKLDSSGNILKQKCYGGSEFEIAYQILQTPDGGYIFGGYTNSEDGDLTITNSAQDYWIVKLDTGLSLEWYHRYGGHATDEAFSIQPTSDSGYVLSGYAYSSNGHVTGHNGMTDCWIVKTNSNGVLQWQKSLGGSDDDQGSMVRSTTDGGYIVSSYASSNDSDVTDNHGLGDMWIVKLDSSGNISKSKSFGGTMDENSSSIIPMDDGGFITAGYSASDDGDVTSNHGTYDYWIVRMDSALNLVWQKSIGGSGIETAQAILKKSDGTFLVLGSSTSNDGDITGNKGATDIWLIKLDSAENVGVKEIQNSIHDFTISPNPVSDQSVISFQLSSPENVRIEVRDIEGRLINILIDEKLSSGENKINWNANTYSGNRASNGFYLITLISDSTILTKKVEVFR